MSKKNKIIKSVLGVVSGVLILFSGIDIYKNYKGQNTGASISIIGGADGPTSIFVAGMEGNNILLYTITVIVVIVAIITFCLYRKKKW